MNVRAAMAAVGDGCPDLVAGLPKGCGESPLKVTYFSPVGTIGGAEMCLLDVLAAVKKARPEWSLGVLLGADGPLREAVAALDSRTHVLPLPGGLARMGDAGGEPDRSRWGRGGAFLARGSTVALGTAAYVARLRRWLRAEAPDVLQTNGMKAHVLGAWAAPRQLPVIWHLHDYTSSRPVMARLLRGAARRGIHAVAVSHSVAEDARRSLGARATIQTIYNAVDLDRFAPPQVDGGEAGLDEGAWLDRAAGLPPVPAGTVRLGLVATFAVWKGHELFLKAISRIPASAGCRFYVVGGPIYQSRGSQVSLEALQAQAQELGLAGRVGFVGHQTDPARAIRSLDVVVHASTRPEPFGRVIAEGMACGRAVVAVNDGGSAELFEEDVTALGCPPRDAAALAHAMVRLAADPSLRSRLGAAGRASACARFDRERLAEPWTQLYRALNHTSDQAPNSRDLSQCVQDQSGIVAMKDIVIS